MSEMSINEIKKYLPHRYPFLLVDKVLSYEAHQSIQAIKNVTTNEPFFNGHFPARPVMPGVMIVEALAQAAGILIVKTMDAPENHKHIFFLAGVDKVRFKRVVEPGDQLLLEAKVMKVKSTLWKFEAKATVNGVLACSAEIMTVQGEDSD